MATRRPRRQRAVIDRVEEGRWAVLLVGRAELEKIVPVDSLPKEARPGTWLKVRVEDGAVHEMEVDDAATRSAEKRVRSKLETLRERGSHFRPIASAQGDAGSGRSAPSASSTPESPAPTDATEPSAAAPDHAPKLLTGPRTDESAEDRNDDKTEER